MTTMDQSADDPSVTLTVDDEILNGPHGELTVRSYGTASDVASSAGLVWVHGGAFAFGDLDMDESDWFARRLASSGASVVSVDYQLAPSEPLSRLRTLAPPKRPGRAHYPIALEEIEHAFQWARATAPQLRWSLGGASAGANLAAGVALRLRDHNNAPPDSLVLAYGDFHSSALPLPPDLKAKLESLPPKSALSSEFIEAMNLNYVGDSHTLSDPYAFPGGHDVMGLPRTLILNSEFDTLRPSGQAFAAELAMAGVDVYQICEPGTRHGHLSRDQPGAARRSIDRILEWMNRYNQEETKPKEQR